MTNLRSAKLQLVHQQSIRLASPQLKASNTFHCKPVISPAWQGRTYSGLLQRCSDHAMTKVSKYDTWRVGDASGLTNIKVSRNTFTLRARTRARIGLQMRAAFTNATEAPRLWYQAGTYATQAPDSCKGRWPLLSTSQHVACKKRHVSSS